MSSNLEYLVCATLAIRFMEGRITYEELGDEIIARYGDDPDLNTRIAAKVFEYTETYHANR